MGMRENKANNVKELLNLFEALETEIEKEAPIPFYRLG